MIMLHGLAEKGESPANDETVFLVECWKNVEGMTGCVCAF
jgi:hypothetical protein